MKRLSGVLWWCALALLAGVAIGVIADAWGQGFGSTRWGSTADWVSGIATSAAIVFALMQSSQAATKEVIENGRRARVLSWQLLDPVQRARDLFAEAQTENGVILLVDLAIRSDDSRAELRQMFEQASLLVSEDITRDLHLIPCDAGFEIARLGRGMQRTLDSLVAYHENDANLDRFWAGIDRNFRAWYPMCCWINEVLNLTAEGHKVPVEVAKRKPW